jgi:hypothetical protein
MNEADLSGWNSAFIAGPALCEYHSSVRTDFSGGEVGVSRGEAGLSGGETFPAAGMNPLTCGSIFVRTSL